MKPYKVIYVNRIPIRNVIGITIFPFIFIERKQKGDAILLRHEEIHIWQQIETLLIGFFVIYLIESLFKRYGDISFEREAYSLESEGKRKMFGWFKYLIK